MIEVNSRQAPVALNFQPAEPPSLRSSASEKVDGNGLSIHELEKFLLDIRDEPDWRVQANRCADYYDHNQLTDEVLAEYRRIGLPPLIIDLIHPTINTVLGMEAKTRTDWKVDWEDEANEPLAQAIGKKLKKAARESQSDRAISNAYAGQIKAGLHWVEVGWNSNPFGPRYRVRDVHRREIWWDWRRREISEWRYLMRRQRFDADQLALSFPQMKEIIDQTMEGTLTWQDYAARLDEGTGLGQFVDIERALTIEEQEWVDFARKQISVYEVWYQKFQRGYVARLGETVIEIDEKNPRHMLAIAHGAMKPVLATYPKLRQAIFIGPYRVFDRPTPLPHRKMPYTPFFGYREDMTGIPYGLVRGMLSPQDEINARRSKSMALLNSRRTQADSDALDLTHNTHEDAADEVSRHDSYIILNPKRINGQHGFKVEDNRDLAQGQQEILQQSKNEIHETSGVFPPMAGDQKGGLSGLAINSLVEQGTQTLAEINDNYTWARREVGDQQLELVKFDNQHEHTETYGEGKNKKQITLNARTWDNNTGELVTQENMVMTAQLKLVLEDVPQTPAWRQQQSAQLAEITKALPPQLQAFVVPFYMEATDLPKRKEIAAILRKQLGIPDDGENPQEDAQIAQLKAERDQAVQELTGHLQQALAETEKLKLANANKEAEAAVKDKDAETKRMAAEERAQLEADRLQLDREIAENERIVALATAVKDEFPKGGGADNAAELQGAIEEILATMRGGFQEMHSRVGKIETAIATPPAKPKKPKASSASDGDGDEPAKPAQPQQIHIHNYPPAAGGKTIKMDTPHGPMTASIGPSEEPAAPAKPKK